MACKASAVKAARAVNSLLGLSGGDQEALLDVLQDYFYSPLDYPGTGTPDDDQDSPESSEGHTL